MGHSNTGEILLARALGHVESPSIRFWATSAHNKPILTRLAQIATDKRGPSADAQHFAAYIVATAIGLV